MGIAVVGQMSSDVPTHAPKAKARDPHAGTPG